MASDSTIGWFLIRVLTNTLIDASDPTSVPNVVKNVVHKFALNPLQNFERNDHQPVYPDSFVLPAPTKQQIDDAQPYQNAPDDAVTFFSQLGDAVVTNPIPGYRMSGTALGDLPSWVTPQAGATGIYLVPSYGQKATLDSFAPIGLTEQGFSVPAKWGKLQLDALQAGYVLAQKTLRAFIDAAAAGTSTNYCGILNDPVGTYPNDAKGYLYRSLIVVEGGVAYTRSTRPTLTGNPSMLDGNHTRRIRRKAPLRSLRRPAC